MSAVVAAADRVRARLLAAAIAIEPLGFVLRRRERRTEARAVLAIATALALTVAAPALMLALGPLLFGVPHVASEVRFLVLRRSFPRPVILGGAAWCAMLVASRVAEQLLGAPHVFAYVEIALAGAGVLLATALGARALTPRLAALGGLFVALGLFAAAHPFATRLAFVHAHNFGAVALWIVFFRRRAGLPRVALATLALAVGLVASGSTIALTARLGGLSALGVDLARVGGWLAPDLPAEIALALALVHALSDSVHYVMWLVVIPEEQARGEGSLTFAMTARALRRDLGTRGLGLVALALLLVLGAAALNLSAARRSYFALAGFHGYLELAALAFLAARGGAISRSPIERHDHARLDGLARAARIVRVERRDRGADRGELDDG